MKVVKSQIYHDPVLLNDVIDWLLTDRSGVYVDGTLGGGGHTEAILRSLNQSGQLIALDRDEEAIRFAGKRLQKYSAQIQYFHEDFRNLSTVLKKTKTDMIDGILFDLGVSSHQLDSVDRGFSYRYDGNLDMRMDRNHTLTAFHVVNQYSEEELTKIFRDYGEERFSRKIARRLVKIRETRPIQTTFDLSEMISSVTGRRFIKKTLSRIFQAIRIEVNQELESVREGLYSAIDFLRSGGRVVVISYHSLEDRIIKHTFREAEKGCICPPKLIECVCGRKKTLKILTRRIVTPSEKEKSINPRSRSAKLRVAERIR